MSRLFYALWPDDRTRARLAAVADALPQRPGRRETTANLHITLLFLGSIAAAERDRLVTGTAAIVGTPFSLELDHCGWWRTARVAWLAPTRIPAPLLQLASDLRQLAHAAGIRTDERPYRPHMTLARKVNRAPGHVEFPPVRWDIDGFSLLESSPGGAGSRYRQLARWPLNRA